MENRYCVIMSGGIGSRFWPFSKMDKPKQFLDFFGTGRSLLQLTFDRFSKIVPIEHIFVVTNEQYLSLVEEQLPEIDRDRILLEPQRRNTAPCIAWASYHIQAIDPNANIIVTPADHLILKETNFAQSIEKGLRFVNEYPALLTLGIKPNRPETGYGYIQMGKDMADEIKMVKTFTEKPNLELAEVFVESGEFVWNSGIFLWNVKTILKAIQHYQPEISNRFEENLHVFNTPLEDEFIESNFASCPNISIDFGVMEKASNVYVLCSDFGWSDLGTWGTLFELAPKTEDCNVIKKGSRALTFESRNNIIALPTGKIAVIQGIEDCIIAESENALLICKKDQEQRIKQFVTDVKVKLGDEYI